MNNRCLAKYATVFASMALLCASNHLAASPMWVDGYWEGNPTVLNGLDWSALTHIIYVGAQPNSDGTVNLGCWYEGNNCPESTWASEYVSPMISTAHGNGVKALLDLRTANDGGASWASATNSQHVNTYASDVVNLINKYGFDGVDLDWEGNFFNNDSTLNSQMAAFISALRAQLPPGKLITVAAGHENAAFWGSQTSKMDQINEMTYDFVGNWNPYSWFNTAVHSDPCNCVWSLDLNRQKMLQGGVPAGKLGLALAFYGYVSTGGGVTGPRQPNSGSPSLAQVTWANLASNYNLSNPHWDSVTQEPWVQMSNGWITFDNPQSIATKIQYMQSNGIGGFIIWSLDKDYMAGKTPTHPLLAAVKSAMGGTIAGDPAGDPPPASAPTISSFAASPNQILPGGSTTLSWTANNATTLSISPGIGTVTGNSISVNPASTTTYTLTATNSYGSVTQSATVTVSSAPVAYWTFDGGTGATAADSSENNHPMTLFNSPTWMTTSQCAVNGCLGFNGTNQYGSSALDLSSTNVVTVAFWLNWTAYANDDRIAVELTPNFNNATDGFLILPDESVSGQFQAGFKGNAGYNQVNFARPSAGVWHHYAFVMNTSAPAATQVIPYVDGQPVKYTKPTSAANTNNFGQNTLFVMSRAGTQLFGNGAIDELQIYPRALSPSEIAALAAHSPSANDTVPAITTTSLASATKGQPYSQELSCSGATPIEWTVSSGRLPRGLSLDSSTGVISGTPVRIGTYSFTVQATNADGSNHREYTLQVVN